MLRLSSLLVILALTTACASSKTLCFTVNACTVEVGKELCGPLTECKEFRPYGIFDTDKRDGRVHYEVVTGNVVWSLLGIESLVLPFFLVGWYLYEPIAWESK
jgi:hypothetical protein